MHPHDYRELLALTRTLEEDATGNRVARWTNRGRADHYAHAEVYSSLAGSIRSPVME